MLMKTHGFTLIELVVTVGVLSLILGIGVTPMMDMWQNAKIRSTATQVVSALQMGRSLAIRNNMTSVVRLNADKSWTVEAPQGTVLNQGSISAVSGITPSPVVNEVAFNSLGTIANNVSINITGPSVCKQHGGEIICLRVEVLAGGAIHTCDPSSSGGDNACSL
jgi:prepilin-type N-terminal cleavage/methylation domain-containing protein